MHYVSVQAHHATTTLCSGNITGVLSVCIINSNGLQELQRQSRDQKHGEAALRAALRAADAKCPAPVQLVAAQAEMASLRSTQSFFLHVSIDVDLINFHLSRPTLICHVSTGHLELQCWYAAIATAL